MDAINFLRKEHDRFRKDLANISKKARRYTTKQELFAAFCRDLIRHEMMEHKVWYPHFKNNKKLKSEVKHLLSEEKHAEKAMKQFKKIKTEDEWEIKFLKFKKEVEHHAREEERDLFPNVRQMLEKSDLEKIGKDMYQFKRHYNR